MKRHEQISLLQRALMDTHQPRVSKARLMEILQCSDSTVKRLIEDLRDRYRHPIEYDRELNGYYYDYDNETDARIALAGLWFNESELTALVTMQHLLGSVQPGLFEDAIAPLGERILGIIDEAGLDASEVADRIRILGIGGRRVDDYIFRYCANAVLARSRLCFTYSGRGGEAEVTRREVSPQRLTFYRSNWYLDAWCHLREGVRVFALERISELQRTDLPAVECTEEDLKRILSSGYGIFAGEATKTAVLRFTRERAEWVAGEKWHSNQSDRRLEDGSLELRIPYAHSHELVMDILKYGPDVEVVEPPELRREVAARVRECAARYEDVVLDDAGEEEAPQAS